MEKYIKNFIIELGTKSKSEHTLIAYRKDLEQLIEYLESINIKNVINVGEDTLKNYFNKLEKDGLTAKTISRKLNSTKTFFKYLVQTRVIKENPSLIITHPRIENVPPRVLSELEYRALRDTARSDPRTYIIIEILLQTGIRIGELCRIRIEDLNLGENSDAMLRVIEYGSSLERMVPLNKVAVDMFQSYLKIRPKALHTDNLFITKNGNPLLIRNIRSSIDATFARADIKNAKVNDLRNTFIAHHLSRGTNIFLLSKIIGHKRIATTEKYIGKININIEKLTPLPSL